MSNTERGLSKHEQAKLAFDGVIGRLGATSMMEIFADADAEMKNRQNNPNGRIEGILYPMPELNEDPDYPVDPDDPFTTTLQVEPEQVSVAFGTWGDLHTLPRQVVEGIIAEHLQQADRQQRPPNA